MCSSDCFRIAGLPDMGRNDVEKNHYRLLRCRGRRLVHNFLLPVLSGAVRLPECAVSAVVCIDTYILLSRHPLPYKAGAARKLLSAALPHPRFAGGCHVSVVVPGSL